MAGAIEHQAPNGKQWLCRNTSQAISGGQATKQDVSGSLKARCFDNCYDDQEVADERKNTKRCVNASCKNIVYERPTVVCRKCYKAWQPAGIRIVTLISHSLVTMTRYVRTEAESI